MALKQRDRVAKSFYEKRALPKPRAQWWPEDTAELREALSASEQRAVLLGDGQHVRTPEIADGAFDVIRTEKCRRIISVDRESRLVRVECGVRWGDLQAELIDRGLCLDRYNLYPATATIGGLLGRRRGVHRELWDGDIRSSFVALSSTARDVEYRYLAAPRKASGPDLRWLFVGAEGAHGAILDATLVAWAPVGARLLTFHPERFGHAHAIVNDMWDLGIRPSWTVWTSYRKSADELCIALHGPDRLLDIATSTLRDRHDVAVDVADAAALSARRQELEAAHPDRRVLATSARTVRVLVSTRDLAAIVDSLPSSIESSTIWTWTRHHAELYLRYARGQTAPELPARISSRALDVRPVRDDEEVHPTPATLALRGALGLSA